MARSAEIQVRQHAVLRLVEDAGSDGVATSDVLDQLRLDDAAKEMFLGKDASAMRKLQRDLQDLEMRGRVEAVRWIKGRLQPVVSGDAKRAGRQSTEAGDSESLLWRAVVPADVEEIESLAAVVALSAIEGPLAGMVPIRLTGDLALARHHAQVVRRKLRTWSPEKRWLNVLRLELPQAGMLGPAIDEDVRDVLETAIMSHRMVRIVHRGEAEEISITGWIVGLDGIEIAYQVPEEYLAGSIRIQAHERRLRLENISSAEMLDTKALEPFALPVAEPGYGEPIAEPTVYEFRASPNFLERVSGKWVAGQISVLGEDLSDSGGWLVCRLEDRFEGSGFKKLLLSAGGEVEILSPLPLRRSLASRYESLARMYADEPGIDANFTGSPDQGPGFPRDWFPDIIAVRRFNDDERAHLEASRYWRRFPALIESLCRVFWVYDPMGIAMDENPNAATEYLKEAEELVDELLMLRSEHSLAMTLERVFQRNFTLPESDTGLPISDWTGLAREIRWTLSTGALDNDVDEADEAMQDEQES